MTQFNGEKDHRPFWAALVFEKDGDLNLSWLFVFIMGIVGASGFVATVVLNRWIGINTTVLDRVAAWSFLGAAFASVLIAAIPVAKAKILANSKLPGEIANSIASVAKSVETSTDIQELSQKQKKSDIG